MCEKVRLVTPIGAVLEERVEAVAELYLYVPVHSFNACGFPLNRSCLSDMYSPHVASEIFGVS